MTKTANSYISDQGELVFNVDLALTAIAYFTTQPEAIVMDAVVRKFEETTPKTREYSEVFVTGSISPIKTMSSKQTATEWTLTILDDYSAGGTGEFGTDTLHAVEMFQQCMDNALVIADLSCTPAGGATGDIETSLVNVDVKSVTHPPIDADATNPQEVVIMLVVESYTKAAHS